MSEIIHPFSDKEAAILRYEPVELNGLVYYPIKVADYKKWQACKPVLCLRQGTLPAVYACMTYLQCVWALSIDAYERGEASDGIWNILACLLFLSLRLSDGDMIQPIGNPDNHKILTSIRITKKGDAYDISAMDFAQVRRLIAEQNGAELPDEADNPDLVEAANETSNSNSPPLNYDFGDMLTSVSSDMRIRRSDILNWTVKELDDILRAAKRRYGYILASIAESQGAKFSKGNPYPTWIFDRAKDEYAGLIPFEKLQSEHRTDISVNSSAPI